MPAKEHEIITGIVIVIIVFMLAGFFILLLVSYYNHRKKKYILEKEMMQQQFRQELLQTQLEIQEQTFKNISEEIHDNIGQALSFIKLNMNMVDLEQKEETRNRLEESKKLLSKAIQDLRDLARMLNTDFISDTGLGNAVEQQLNILEKTGAYTTELRITGEKEKYQLQRELVVFRIVQELLNNIVKHASASSILVKMDYLPDQLVVAVEDNGAGFIKEKVAPGLGLRNIEHRIKLIGGTADIESSQGTGTCTTIRIFKNGTANGKI